MGSVSKLLTKSRSIASVSFMIALNEIEATSTVRERQRVKTGYS